MSEKESLNGTKQFKDLAEYALTCLVTPVSNAVVERVFSQVTAMKTKVRNRLGLRMLDAVIRIRAHLHARSECCKDFMPNARMLQLFNNADMYGAGTHSDESDALTEMFD